MASTAYKSDEVMVAFERQNYEFVLSKALPHAIAGNPDAQCTISLLYQCDFCVPKDLAKAEEWLLKATAQDSALAWNNLGTLYAVGGPGLSHGREKTYECYLKAKELGFDCASPYPPWVPEG
jgi:TPR repeat protein